MRRTLGARWSCGAWGWLVSAALAATAWPAAAQLQPVVIRDAAILNADGSWRTGCDVSFGGGTISAIGGDLDAGLLARKIDGRGKFVTPGFIDVWGITAARLGGNGAVTAQAADAFDVYDEDARLAAWRDGILVTYVPARVDSGWGGTGAVFALKPEADRKQVLLEQRGALHAALGVDPRQGVIARVRTGQDLRKALQAARDYRRALEEYEEDVKEYEKKVGERAAKSAESKEGDKKDAEKKDGDKKDGAASASVRAAVDSPEGEAGAEGVEPAGMAPVAFRETGAQAEDDEKFQAPPRGRPRRPGPPPGSAPRPGGPGAAAADDDKKDDLKKPAEPRKDAASEALLDLLDGETVLRVEAYAPQEIAQALDLAEEFHFGLILEGAYGAGVFADRLAKLGAAVIVAPQPPAMLFSSGVERYYDAGAVGALARAGVSVYIGSGPAARQDDAPPHLTLRAALAVAGGMEERAVLSALTSGAAQLLGIEKKHGTLAKGRPADLVVWSGHPLDGQARVEMVFLDGQQVYTAPRTAANTSPGDKK